MFDISIYVAFSEENTHISSFKTYILNYCYTDPYISYLHTCGNYAAD